MNGPYGKIPTKKEPIRTLGFTSSLSCHIIIHFIIASKTMNNNNYLFLDKIPVADAEVR